MNKKSIIFLIIAIIILLLAIALFTFANNKNSSSEDSNIVQKNSENKKTELTFSDSENKEYKFSDFSDKPIALLLWNSDTENSMELIELTEKYYNDYSNNINFLVLNTNEKNTDIIDIVKKSNFEIPIYYDTNSKVSDFYSFQELPTFIFFNKDGKIENQVEKNITEDAYLANLDIISENY